ncbi:5-methyltetrahydropteroyltriglutamate--homocysteine S-methyltransferase [Pectinatus frisingensis]|uniref:5-methyltetrahydropteroyltriglutamate-- homocysteine S-methyltransferase n=1 Tax=Pectinatus frisingensis TaxID=865 RepID=UPI0018C7AFBA|nr:5-methyltetrahydropteroyltriglutamate--homocysteine S-methyltransferase [Pectinatus frisingensis]
MQYSVVGFPRIGAQRELKFTVEKYFRNEINTDELLQTTAKLRAKQWKLQQTAGAAFIPSNDFSLYDGMLDTSFMLNAIPQRYLDLNLDDTAAYFAMARGYQGHHGDVKATAMKKWFNTNYHYMVPELDDTTNILLRSDHFLDGFHQAQSLGINTKPVIIGPFTFLKLASFTGHKNIADYVDSIKTAYNNILKSCATNKVDWLQIDEPYLVMDLTANDIALFTDMYQFILEKKGTVKVLLQTYFGDVRDCCRQLYNLQFDGIGLDFLEGKETTRLTTNFPDDKILFAGLINGKNIWRCNYNSVLSQLKNLKAHCRKIILSTSCSLLHVPYTVTNEPQLAPEITRCFSFAYEKLEELREICRLTELPDYQNDPAYQQNCQLFQSTELRIDKTVQEKVAALTNDDFTRAMPRKKRQALQRKILNLPLLPTTTIGSFPQTKAVKQNRSQYRHGVINETQYRSTAKHFIKDCIKFQEEIGLDVLVHGEFERDDMVEFFGENLKGYVFTTNAWVQSYGTRGLKPPIIFGDIKREKSITTDYIKYAASLTDKDVKGMLTGPVTILNWSFPREDISTREMMYQIGLAIREEVLELEQAGIRIIQIDEAALREKLPLRHADWHSDYLDFAIKAFRLCHAKVKPTTQIHTHMCYSEFEDIIPEIDAMDADVITFEASRSKLTILTALQNNHFETEVGPGVYDIHSPRVPSVTEIEAAIHLMLQKIPQENLWINPDCGLKTRGKTETAASLKNLVQAAKNVRTQLTKGDKNL